MPEPERTQGGTPHDEALAALLAAYGIRCPWCAYDLSGISAGVNGLRCPECGLLLTRRIIRQAADWRRLAVRRMVMIFGSLGVALGAVLVDSWTPDGPTLLPLIFLISLMLAVSALIQEFWSLRKGRMTSPGTRFQNWFTILFACGGSIGALIVVHALLP